MYQAIAAETASALFVARAAETSTKGKAQKPGGDQERKASTNDKDDKGGRL
jgi:hypothetical protein